MREKYESLSLATLKDLAKARGLKGVSALRKPELIERMLHEDELEGETKKQETVEKSHKRLINSGLLLVSRQSDNACKISHLKKMGVIITE